jgi:hypothetical protein
MIKSPKEEKERYCSSMKYNILMIMSLLVSLIVSGCFYKPNPKPRLDGAADVFNNDGIYYALFPRTFCSILIPCGPDSARINIDRKFVLDKEKVFRESYYKLIVEPVEKMHPDSSGNISEYEGTALVVKQVNKLEYLRRMHIKYKTSIAWDRQYLGFVNSKKDTILIINMVDPDEFSRDGLGEDWSFGTDAANFETIAFNLSDNSITYNCWETIK